MKYIPSDVFLLSRESPRNSLNIAGLDKIRKTFKIAGLDEVLNMI
ncbi:MAG: hypothetical protein AB2L24_32420 [Mangrovibacterium sp.]